MDSYITQNTQYEADEAEYDAADYNYQILDDEGEIVALFSDEKLRNKVAAFLSNAS